MRKSLVALAVTAALLTGCTSTPTPESAQSRAYAAGQLAAYVASTSPKFTPEIKAATIVVLEQINKTAPVPGQTLSQTWTPVINEETDALVGCIGSRWQTETRRQSHGCGSRFRYGISG